MRRRLALAALLAGLLIPAAPAAAAATWQLEQPPPPPGARFKVPLGAPGDLEFWAPNEGLLSVQGNAVVPGGLFYYDGRGWHQLSTVCGDTADTSRIAWASPDEFWVVTEPSFPRFGSGLGLCHFKDGAVIGSYSTPINSSDPFQAMDAAVCRGPDDCWFAGAAGQDPLGERAGSFELHWNGTSLTTGYSPQGRGISDIQYFAGRWYETAFAGAQREDRGDPTLVSAPEPYGPELLRGLGLDGVWRGLNFLPHPIVGVPGDGTELLAANADATDLWFAGGGAGSGPDAPVDGSVPRPPIAVHLHDRFYEELGLAPTLFGPTDRFVDIAAVPGTTEAWVADQPFGDRASTNAKAKVALLQASGSAEVFTLPAAGAGRGSAARIACPATNDCWMVTSAGWVFHYTDGTVYRQNTDPNWTGTISTRPNEAAPQFIPTTPPPDDSLPPPNNDKPKPRKRKVIKPMIRTIRKPHVFAAPKLHGYALVVKMFIVRSGRVEVLAYRHKKIVARTKLFRVHRGWATFRLLIFRKRWPTALGLILIDHGKRIVVGPGNHHHHKSGGGGNTITTAPDAGAGGSG